MNVRASIFPVIVFAFFANQAPALAGCECTVTVGNQNRWIWGSWALECNGHKGHGDCPTTNIDTAHSPGVGAMTGQFIFETRTNNAVRTQWKKTFPDDHVTAFKGPIVHDGWEWTNVCSCDSYYQGGDGQWWDPNSPMYSGALNDGVYVEQYTPPTRVFDYACDDPRLSMTIFNAIEENDPWSPNDPMGQIGIGVPVQAGQNNYVQWVEHFEPAVINGKRTHAGWAGGNFGAEMVVRTSCHDSGQPYPAAGNLYQGCFTDDGNRALPLDLGGNHTIESCIRAGRASGATFVGLQWYGQCFGGWGVGYDQVDNGECNTPCSANGLQTCGGAWRNSIYSTAL